MKNFSGNRIIRKLTASLVCAAMLLPAAVTDGGAASASGNVPEAHQAYMLCYNTSMKEFDLSGMNSGWVFDNRGGPVNTPSAASLTDISTEYGTAFIREFNRVGEGRIMLETSVTAIGDGAYLAFCDDEDKTVWQLGTVDGSWAITTADGSIPLTAAGYSSVQLRAYIDLDRMISETYIAGKFCGFHPLLSDNVLSFRFATDEKSTATLTPGAVHIEANYSVCEVFDFVGIFKDDRWAVSGDCRNEGNEFRMYGEATARKDFDPISGKVCTEAYMLPTDDGDTALVLKDGDAAILTVASEKGTLKANGTELYKLNGKVCNRIRIEADLGAGTADILLNGRSVGTVKVSGDKVDSLTLENDCSTVRLDNIYVYNLVDFDDYVPEPETRASADDYLVGINVCSLWVNGSHRGWACNTAYDDIEPVLGYYDEGNPESADWEIKYLVDHGVDFQSFCWYCDNANGPIKCPFSGIRNQIHDGYMYAKYSDYMSYSIIWEAQSGVAFNQKQFREYVIPCWFENYFLDSRYLKIENKPVLSVFASTQLATSRYFGSPEAVKEEFDYLEEVAKSYGFDGMIYLACNDVASANIAALGFDGVFAYNWGDDGASLSETKDDITKYQYSSLETVPTISVGFNDVGWSGQRSPLMTLKDYDKAHEWVTEEYLPGYMSETWSENLVMISSWNEYGEGTYLMPAEGLCGFGYLDVLRKYYTDLPEKHTDVVPTEAQKERINHLYPQYARRLKRQMNALTNYTYPEGVKDLYVNGVLIGNTIKPEVANGVTLYPFDECAGISSRLGSFTTWRKKDGTLKLEANGHTAIFTVGSDILLADGKEVKLKNAVTLTDGVPMIDFAALCEAMGWDYSVTLGKAFVATHQMPEILKKSLRRDGAWEFESPLDPEGWSPSSMSCTVSDGKMTLTTTTLYRDPILRNSGTFALDASKYSELEVRCRYTHDGGDSQIMQMFFLTDTDQAWSEGKSVILPLAGQSSGEDWYTVRVSLAECAGWKDTVTNLRFDPFNALGTMEIDYIRLIRDPSTLVPGDATGDGRVSLKDAQTVMMLLAGWGVTADKDSADADGDNAISAKDVTEIMRRVTGWKK